MIRFRQELFWDINPKSLDTKKHAHYIIERILDFGNDNEVRWLWNFYSHSVIKDVVRKSKGLQDKSRVLWTLLTEGA